MIGFSLQVHKSFSLCGQNFSLSQKTIKLSGQQNSNIVLVSLIIIRLKGINMHYLSVTLSLTLFKQC